MSVSDDATKLVTTHYRGVWAFLRVLGADRARADDVTQETFLTVLNRPFEDFDDRASASYLRMVARGLYIDSLRAEARAKARNEAKAAEEAWREIEDEKGEDRRIEPLKRCLETIEPNMREALARRYKDGTDAETVANELQMSEAALNTALHRAKKALKDCVERKLSHD